MPVSQQIISLLQYLLPGFLAAWVFYGLTSYAKPSHFERVIQALIFTLFIQVIVFIGGHWLPHDWTEKALPFFVAIPLGIVFSVFVNRDWLHSWLRKARLTTKTSFETEWCESFERHGKTYVTLHLKDGRRLIGWPEIWSDNPHDGHLFLTHAAWVQGKSDRTEELIELDGVRGILVDTSHVNMVEFTQ